MWSGRNLSAVLVIKDLSKVTLVTQTLKAKEKRFEFAGVQVITEDWLNFLFTTLIDSYWFFSTSVCIVQCKCTYFMKNNDIICIFVIKHDLFILLVKIKLLYKVSFCIQRANGMASKWGNKNQWYLNQGNGNLVWVNGDFKLFEVQLTELKRPKSGLKSKGNWTYSCS